MDNFEAVSTLIFIQREIFNILLSERNLRHRELYNKGNAKREFDTVYIVVVRQQLKSIRNDGEVNKLAFKTNGILKSPGEG